MILQTSRLLLRPFTLNDLDAFAALLSDEEVMRFSLSGPMKDRSKARDYLEKRILSHYAKHGYGLNAVISKAGQNLIGFVGLTIQQIDGEEHLELGYRIHPGYWGLGLATEAAKEVIHYAFDSLKASRLISIIDPRNERSISVAKRAGMHFWKDAVFHEIPVGIWTLDHPAESLRSFNEADIEELGENFHFPWCPRQAALDKWKRYHQEQLEGRRIIALVETKGRIIGYGNLLRRSDYPGFEASHTPEISDLWIDEKHRGKGLGKRLIVYFEHLARKEGYKQIGIGVGLYKDYGPAQVLYAKLGYIPDGNGATYKGVCVAPGSSYPMDDDLIYWLTKVL